MAIVQTLPGPRVYLDTNVFIYLLEGYPGYVAVLAELFQRVDDGTLQAVTSELTLAEALIKPLTDRNDTLERAYCELIQSTDGLRVEPVTRDILIEAARLRAAHGGVRLPDAIHAATALDAQCQSFVTNDSGLKVLPDLNVVLLSEFAVLR